MIATSSQLLQLEHFRSSGPPVSSNQSLSLFFLFIFCSSFPSAPSSPSLWFFRPAFHCSRATNHASPLLKVFLFWTPPPLIPLNHLFPKVFSDTCPFCRALNYTRHERFTDFFEPISVFEPSCQSCRGRRWPRRFLPFTQYPPWHYPRERATILPNIISSIRRL